MYWCSDDAPACEQAVNNFVHSLLTALFGQPFVKNKAFQFKAMAADSRLVLWQNGREHGGLKNATEGATWIIPGNRGIARGSWSRVVPPP